MNKAGLTSANGTKNKLRAVNSGSTPGLPISRCLARLADDLNFSVMHALHITDKAIILLLYLPGYNKRVT